MIRKMMAIGVLFLWGCSSTVAVPPYSPEPLPQSEFIPVITPAPEFWEAVPSLNPSPSPKPSPKSIANNPTPKGGWKTVYVTWYGPGLYCESDTLKGCLKTGREWHNGTACGQLYTTEIIGVAHRTLPCGTMVTIKYKDKQIRVPVIDRGPYTRGVMFDMSGGLCKYLNHCFSGLVQYK